MLVLKSFANVSSEEELSALMKTLKKFYAQRLEKELDRLWTDGTLDQMRLDELQSEHIVDKKRKIVLDTNALLQMLGRHSKYISFMKNF